MLTAIFMGFLSAIALVILMSRIDIRKFVGYPVIVDIIGSVLFAVIFAGTLTGMMVAVIAALTFSAIIFLVRLIMGYERFDIKSRSWQYYPPRVIGAV